MTATEREQAAAGLPGIRDDLAHEQLADKLGIEITDWNPQRLVATMPVAGNRQPYGLLHGGASAVLAETIGSTAAALNAPRDRVTMGIELSCSHHRAAVDGVVTGICTPLHAGRSAATYEIAIYDESEKRICTARLTCIMRERPPADAPS